MSARTTSGRELSLDLDDDEVGFGGLMGSGIWANPEANRDEWTTIAACLRNRSPIRFKRAALRFAEDGTVELWSPRNAAGDSDVVRVPADQVDALADMVCAAVGGSP